MDAHTLLKTYYGYDEFRGGQEEIIQHILKGQDAVGIMPTGAGKSICYQIPAMLLKGITIVISPLISLMQDQVHALTQNDIPAAFINSSLTSSQYHKVLQSIKQGEYKILYIAPERLLNEAFIKLAQELDIAMVSVDEAHCISHWGQDFRPSYLKIVEFIKLLPKRPILTAFTATATTRVKEDIITTLQLQDPFTLTTGFDRKNLYFEVRHPKNKDTELYRILQGYKQQSGIVYCSTRKQVEEVCSNLQEKGFSAGMYHAGLSEELRKRMQNDFLYDNIQIMVATNAFGMGIDKSNVSFVIHYNMPKDMESYYQEAGRAGRDGSDAKCILLYSGGDVKMNRFLIDVSLQKEDMDPQTQAELKARDLERLKIMTFYCHSDECLRHYILKYFGEDSDPYCGNCFNCNHNFETVDITIEAQKILSCIKRMQERYGVNMVVDVLRGSRNERVMRLGLNKLSTYGIMADVSAKRVRDIIQFLLYHGFIVTSKEEYPVLQVGAKAKEILVDKKAIEMKIVKEKEELPAQRNALQHDVNADLLAQLKEVRSSLAKKQHVPAYIIFNDAALLDMCRILPKTEDEFLLVSGVGEAKLKKYGKYFLSVMQAYQQKEE